MKSNRNRMRILAVSAGIAISSIQLNPANSQQSLQQQYYNNLSNTAQDEAKCIAERNKIAKTGWYPPFGWAGLGSVFYVSEGRVRLFAMKSRIYPNDKFCEIIDRGPYQTIVTTTAMRSELGLINGEDSQTQWLIENGKLCRFSVKSGVWNKMCLHKIGNKNPNAFPPANN